MANKMKIKEYKLIVVGVVLLIGILFFVDIIPMETYNWGIESCDNLGNCVNSTPKDFIIKQTVFEWIKETLTIQKR